MQYYQRLGVLVCHNYPSMKIIAFIITVIVLSSCARSSVTPYQAANNHYQKCRAVR